MAIEKDRTRAHGRKAADAEADKAAKDLATPMEEGVLDIERELIFQSTTMHRFPVEWTGDNAVVMTRIKHAIDDVLHTRFADAYEIMEDLYLEVREVATDEEGEPILDERGQITWVKTESGAYVEDWTRLTTSIREDFLLRITTLLFEWEQAAASLWTESMFGKALWVENFAIEFNKAVSGTVDDRNKRADSHAAAERYFAVYTSALSRHADALVRSMERITLRLKDTL